MKGRFWIAIIVALMLSQRAHAQKPAGDSAPAIPGVATSAATVPLEQQATKEQLRKLFEVMRLRQQFEEMMKMLPSLVQKQVRTQMDELTARLPGAKPFTPEQQEALAKLMSKYMDKARTLYPADEMIDDAISVYQRHISREDADAYISFFSSPPGQHFLDAQPAIMKEYLPIAMERAQKRTQELNAEMTADVMEFAKSSGATK